MNLMRLLLLDDLDQIGAVGEAAVGIHALVD